MQFILCTPHRWLFYAAVQFLFIHQPLRPPGNPALMQNRLDRGQVLKTMRWKFLDPFAQKLQAVTKTSVWRTLSSLYTYYRLFRFLTQENEVKGVGSLFEPWLYLNMESGCSKEHTWPEKFGSILMSPSLKRSIVIHKQNPVTNVNRISAAPGN